MDISQSPPDSSSELATTSKVVTVQLVTKDGSVVYTDTETGINYISQKGAAAFYGVTQQSVSLRYKQKQKKSLEASNIKGFSGTSKLKFVVDKKLQPSLSVITEEDFIEDIEYYASQGKEAAIRSLAIFARIGVRVWGHQQSGYQTQAPAPSKATEPTISDFDIQVELLGSFELQLTPAFSSAVIPLSCLVVEGSTDYATAKEYLHGDQSQITYQFDENFRPRTIDYRLEGERKMFSEVSGLTMLTLSKPDAKSVELTVSIQGYLDNPDYLSMFCNPMGVACKGKLDLDYRELRTPELIESSSAIALRAEQGSALVVSSQPTALVNSADVCQGDRAVFDLVFQGLRLALRRYSHEKPFTVGNVVQVIDMPKEVKATFQERDYQLVYAALVQLTAMGNIREASKLQFDEYTFYFVAKTLEEFTVKEYS